MNAKVSPELQEVLRKTGGEPVQAIIQLQPAHPIANLSVAEINRISNSLLDRVADEVGARAIRSNLLPNLRTLIVEAAPEFVRSMIQHPEVASAAANQTKESALIPPHRKRPVD